jgi:sec-independent protein translocase protein TatA
MFGMGMQELVFIMIIALLLFGAKRLPEIGKSLGRSISAFKDGLKEGESEEKKPSDPASDKKA